MSLRGWSGFLTAKTGSGDCRVTGLERWNNGWRKGKGDATAAFVTQSGGFGLRLFRKLLREKYVVEGMPLRQYIWAEYNGRDDTERDIYLEKETRHSSTSWPSIMDETILKEIYTWKGNPQQHSLHLGLTY